MPTASNTAPFIALAGGTGGLGSLIAEALVARHAKVKALVRSGTAPAKPGTLRVLGIETTAVDFASVDDMARALDGASCVISALNGLRGVIIDTQTVLLEAAVKAGVPRFIPSDFSLDFTKTKPGSNRNLDLRRDFHARLERAPIAWTSVLNGAFMDMLVGEMPIIVEKIHRVVHVGSADQALDFTTMADAAAFTAEVALDASTPKILRISGETLDARALARAAGQARGGTYKTLRVGGVGLLEGMIGVTRKLTGGEDKVFPPWQGMQYMANMFSGAGKLEPLDNERYPDLRWTKVAEVLSR